MPSERATGSQFCWLGLAKFADEKTGKFNLTRHEE